MKDIDQVLPHDKSVGLTIINSRLIEVSIDDNFEITGSIGVYQQKILPATGTIDRNRINFIKLATPLY